MVIGVTGGIGCGKSLVLQILKQEFDAYLLEADAIAHVLMEPEHSCYTAIIDRFGKNILKEDGKIDRTILGNLVFSDSVKLNTLNDIIHPMVYEYILGEIHTVKLENPARIIVIEAALLLEARYDRLCDEIWYIHAEEKIRRKRLYDTRKYSDEKINAIMKHQLSEEKFREGCQRVIENNGSQEAIREQVQKILAVYE